MYFVLGWLMCLIASILTGISVLTILLNWLDTLHITFKWLMIVVGLIFLTAFFGWAAWAFWTSGAFLFV